MDIQLPFTMPSGAVPVVIVGTILQIYLLKVWHRTPSLGVVLLRTLVVQSLVLFAGITLNQRWPFSFPSEFRGYSAAFLFAEGFVVIWYLLQRRAQPYTDVDGERFS
jgi:hypothetical protein